MIKTLKCYRKDKGLTLREVSISVDVEVSTLSRVERGLQHPRPETAKRLAYFYGLTVGDIYNIVNDEKAA